MSQHSYISYVYRSAGQFLNVFYGRGQLSCLFEYGNIISVSSFLSMITFINLYHFYSTGFGICFLFFMNYSDQRGEEIQVIIQCLPLVGYSGHHHLVCYLHIYFIYLWLAMQLALADFSSHMISASIDVPPVYRLHTISAEFLICSTA